MSSPFFSVVIPTKGRSFLVGEAIQSVLRQSFRDFELVVTDNDDGTDTQRVVAQFKDPRVRYHRTGGLPMPENWESGCSQARGEYLVILEDKQALKFSALERVYRQVQHERPSCIRWQIDWLDDTGRVTYVDRVKGRGAPTRLSPEEILKAFASHGLAGVGSTLPIAHYSAFHRDLVKQIKAGPAGRLCPPISPDYTLAFLALAYAKEVLCFHESLAASSRLNSNGRSFSLKKGHLRKQFLTELGGKGLIFFDLTPVKAITVPGAIYNDYARLQGRVGGRLRQFPFSPTSYFIEIHRFITECRSNGVEMEAESSAWTKALSEQAPQIQAAVRAAAAAEGGLGQRLHLQAKALRRKTGILWVEHRVRDQLRVLRKRKLAGQFRTLLQYVEWDDAEARRELPKAER